MRCGVRRLLFLMLLLSPALPSPAETHVTVDIGWGERARSGTWTPIFVTVSDPKPRNAFMQLKMPHDSSTGMRIAQPIAIGPSEQTYVLYAPLIYSYGEPVSLEIRDAAGGRALYDRPLLDQTTDDYDSKHRNLFRNVNASMFIAVSGRAKAMGQLDTGNNSTEVAFLQQEFLPDVTKGYDAVDVLFLNQPNLSTLRPTQQSAILDWVRAGGHLLFCPSEEPIPPGSALVKALPCDMGDTIALSVAPADLQRASLPQRFGKFKARTLTPAKGVTSIPLLGASGATAVRGKLGLGFVSVVSFDTSDLMFDTPDGPRRFWSPVLNVTPHTILDGGSSYSSQQIQDPQRAAAAGQIIDVLGNVPGVGSFGFKYVAMVLLAMMVIVGPVDWFVLKKLGRQQWTWATTLGWIGLVTTGAIFIGSIFRSGDLHYRTIQVIDQTDGALIARTDIVGIYSPKTDDYRLDTPPGTWWEPISTDQYSYNGRGMMQTLDFTQDGRAGGNVPGEMTINVWNLRFLSSESPEKGDAVIAADVILDQSPAKKGGPAHLIGSITNLGISPLQHAWVRLPSSLGDATTDLALQAGWPAAGLAHGATRKIDLPVQPGINGNYWSVGTPTNIYQNGAYGQRAAGQPADPLALVKAACYLSPRRQRAFDDQLLYANGSGKAIIYALSEPADPAVKLIDHQALEKHWQVIRALVPLKRIQ